MNRKFLINLTLLILLLGTSLSGCQGKELPAPEVSATITPALGSGDPSYSTGPLTSAPSLTISTIGSLGKGVITPILQTPDKKLYLYNQTGTMHVVDAVTIQEVGSIPNICEDLRGEWFSPDSHYLVFSCGFGTNIIDLKELRYLGHITVETTGSLTASEFSRDGKLLAYKKSDWTSGGSYGSIGVWDISAEKNLNLYESGEDPYISHYVTYPSISPNGHLVAAGYQDANHSFILIWDSKTTELLQKIPTPTWTNDVAFSLDGSRLASGDTGGMVHLWNPATGQEIKTYGGFFYPIEKVRYLDATRLKIWQSEQSIRILNLTDGSIDDFLPTVEEITPLEQQLFSHGLVVRDPLAASGLAMGVDGRYVAQFGSRIILYDGNTGEALRLIYPFPGKSVLNMVFDASAGHMAALGTGGELAVWETSTGRELYRGSSSEGIRSSPAIGSGIWGDDTIALSPDGLLLAAGDGTNLGLVDLSSGEAWFSGSSQLPDVYITNLEFSQDGKQVYTILNRNRAVQVWDTQKRILLEEIWLPQPDPNAFTAVDLAWPYLARNNYEFEYPQEDYWIELWNLETRTYQKLKTEDRSTGPFIFSADGRMLYAMNNQILYAWRTSDGRPVGKTSSIFSSSAITASQDGRVLAYDDNGIIKIMDASEFTSHLDQVDKTISTPAVIVPEDLPESPRAIPKTFIFPAQNAPSGEVQFVPSMMITKDNTGQVSEAGHFSPGAINALRWESDGSQAIIAGSHSLVSLYPQGKLNLLCERNVNFTTTARRTDGHLIASGVLDGFVFVYDATLDQLLVNLEGVGKPALSPDGNYLVYKTNDGNLLTYDLVKRKALAVLSVLSSENESKINPIFSPDGTLVAGLQGTRLVRIWDVQTGSIFNAVGGPDAPITDLSFSSDGRYLVAAGAGSAWVWEVKPGGKLRQYEFYKGVADENLILYQDTVTAAGISPDNTLLAIGTSRHDIHLYSLATGKLTLTLSEHTAPITQLSFDPGSQYLLSADRDGSLILWKASAGTVISRTNAFTGSIAGLEIRDNGLVSAWGENSAWTLDPTNATLVSTTSTLVGKILTASPDGKYLVVYKPLQVYLADATSGKLLSPLEGEAQEVFVDSMEEGKALRQFYGATFSHDGRQLATYGAGGLWLHEIDDASGKLLKHIEESTFTTKAIFSPDDRYLVFSWNELRLGSFVYDLQEIDSTDDFPYISMMDKVVYSPSGRWLAGTILNWAEPTQIVMWDMQKGKVEIRFPMDTGSDLTALAFSLDDSILAVGQENGSILLVDATTGEILKELTGHTGSITALAFTTDGLYLVSGSTDGTVGFWAVSNP
jgi:WD40 repeat protein